MLKTLRQNKRINSCVRKFLKRALFEVPAALRAALIPRWRVTGIFNFVVENENILFSSRADDNIADALYYSSEEYDEFVELRLFAQFAKMSDVIFDVGANTGVYSIVAAKVNPQAKVLAFEPFAPNWKRLKSHVKLNAVTNIEIIAKAVGDQTGNITMTVPTNGQVCDVVSAAGDFTRSFYKQWLHYEDVEIEQTTLDKVFQNAQLPKIDLIKIDVENYEMPVFKGAKQMLEEFAPVILCEMFVDETRLEFFRTFLQPLNYYCYVITAKGLFRVSEPPIDQDNRNFIFSKYKSPSDYLSYQGDFESTCRKMLLQQI